MTRKDWTELAGIMQRNLLAALSADKFRAHGDVHQSLITQVIYDMNRFCAQRSPTFQEQTFLVACGLGNLDKPASRL